MDYKKQICLGEPQLINGLFFTQKTIELLKFSALMNSKNYRVTQINAYYSQIINICMSKKSFDFEYPKKNKIVNQESILHLLQKKSMRNKEICEKLEAKSNRVSYHLQKLLDMGKIEKNGDVYTIVKESPSKLNELIFTILEENNCREKPLKEIFEKIKKSSNDFVSLIETDLQQILDLDLKNSIKLENGNYLLEDYILGERGFCFFCRKKITENQLKIGMLTHGPWGGTNLWPLHATCRSQLYNIVDESSTICDYCGLDLKRYYTDPTKITPSMDNALAKLYDDPFSQIFSHLDSEHYASPSSDIDSVFGFAHYKEKDGKKYHPYCLRIINGEKHQ